MRKELKQRLYNFYEQYDPYGFSDYASEYDNSMEAIESMEPATIIEWLTDIVEKDDDFAEEAQFLISAIEADKLLKESEIIATREYAIFEGTLETALEDREEPVFKSGNPGDIIAELDSLDDDDKYIIEEYMVDVNGEFYEGSDFDTVENFRNRYGKFYAVQCANWDNDLGTGSYDKTEAFKMLRNYPEGHIAVVQMGSDPTVVETLTADDFEEIEED